jgi:epidermal growth factor receptor substrate 15
VPYSYQVAALVHPSQFLDFAIVTMGFFATEEEMALVSRILARAGSQMPGAITGDAAVEIFAETVDLSPAVLGTIWNVADEGNNGTLSERGLGIAIRLIGWAQSGEEVTAALVNIRRTILHLAIVTFC